MIANVGGAVVWIVTVLLIALGLPPPLTVAVFVTVAGALATLTGIEIGGYWVPPPFNASDRVHWTNAPVKVLQSQPVPAGVPTVKSA